MTTTIKFGLTFVVGLVMMISSQVTYGQKFIQLELPGDPIALKYYEGMSISYKLSDYPDDWFSNVIREIKVDNEILVFEDGYITMGEITHIRRYRDWAKAIGYALNTFGVVWLTYGGLAHAFSDFEFGIDTAVIGGSALIGGWILRKWLYKKDYKLGKHARLRMLDITMPSPEDVYQNK